MGIIKRSALSNHSTVSTVNTVSSVGSSDLWESAPTTITRRGAMVLIYGNTGSGRTTFAFTAPGPIAYLHSIEKIDGIIQPVAHKIQGVHDFGRSVNTNQSSDRVAAEAMQAWRRVKAAINDAVRWARTIIIDTETDLWELIRFAYFGDVKPEKGRLELNWGPVNADWKGLMRTMKANQDINIILVDQTEDEYVDSKTGFGKKTGKTIRKGQKSIPFMSDVVIRTQVDIANQQFGSVIEKSWWNSAMLGLEIPGELSNFPSVMGMITEMGEEQWSE